MMIGTILLVFAFVLSFCAALGWPALPPRHLGWAAFCQKEYGIAEMAARNAIDALLRVLESAT